MIAWAALALVISTAANGPPSNVAGSASMRSSGATIA